MKSMFMHYKGGLTREECDLILGHASKLPHEAGTIRCADNQCRVMEDMRVSEIAWIRWDDPVMRWLFDRMVIFVAEANMKCFQFELANWPRLSFRSIQFTQYHAAPAGEDEKAGRFEWHRDMRWCENSNVEADRKITACVMLSDPEEYEGGQFHLEEANLEDRYTRKGDVLIFPSIFRHKVDAVTRGTRNVLAFWADGPPLQ